MAMIRLPHEFKEFFKLLNDHDVKYLLIDGWAVAHYGHVRYTGDIDFWVSGEQSNAEKLVNVLNDFGLTGPDISTALFTDLGNIVRFGSVPMRIEILTEISGVEFDACFSSRVETFVDEVPVHVISLSDLLVNKRASGRHKDLADLEELGQSTE